MTPLVSCPGISCVNSTASSFYHAERKTSRGDIEKARGLHIQLNPRALRAFFGFHGTCSALALKIFSESGNNRHTEIAAFVNDTKTEAKPGRFVQ